MFSYREKLFEYIRKKYKVKEEYLWARFEDYAVFRHKDNQKWFALIMDIPECKLGIKGDEIVDVINLKLNDPFMVDSLIQREGYFKGYHISRGNWVSILLDGTVEFDEICMWLNESYFNTASKETKQKMRPPMEWLIPANPKYYDIQGAFEQAKEIDWKQGKGIKKGDIVYMYVAAPVSAILYKCKVTKTDIPFEYDDGRVRMSGLMKIKLLKRYKPGRFTLKVLDEEYGISTVRGPRGIPGDLSEALKK